MASEMKTVSVSLENDDDAQFQGGILSRDGPYSASQRSSASSNSVVSQNPNVVTSPLTANNLFAFKEGAVDNAIKICKTTIVNGDVDGNFVGAWLITEIDHWDMEKERLILLMSKTLLIVNYDFIRIMVNDFRRIMLHTVHRVQIGDLAYPASSLMPPRQHGGVRIHWGTTEPTLLQRWNPLCTDIGYITLSHHLLAYRADEHETVTYNVGDFADSLMTATNKARRLSAGDDDISMEKGPIMIESYGSVASMVFNQSHLGFNLARGGVSF